MCITPSNTVNFTVVHFTDYPILYTLKCYVVFLSLFTGDSVAAYQLNGYGGFSDEWEDHMLGPYDEFHPKYDKKLSKLRKPFVWLSTVSSGPSMFIDFLTDGTGTGLGFRVSLNMRPASM